jgi:2-polyprenyl-6-methoxyphenol hydroxylase-like FAD-dependent oxidoreductase
VDEFSGQVVIVGGGPVGLTLAMDLAFHGVEVVVAEQRHAAQAPSVKCNHVSARSMEVYRRLGVAGALRDAGLPPDHPHDVAFRTTFLGREFGRIPIPSRRDRATVTTGPDVGWPTPEPPHRINQLYMEPVLFAHADAHPRIRIVNRTVIDTVAETADGVVARGRHLDTGASTTFRGAYLVGCDGGRSIVRRQLDIALAGDAVVQRVQSSYIRAPRLLERLKVEPAWATIALNPRRSGTAYAIDGHRTWLVHNYLRPDEDDFDTVDRDWALRTILGVDDDFDYELLSKEDWFGRRLIADRFRHGRMFLCGDSAHIWVPYAGYGMNAGIADAANLAWLLGAHLNGWAPAAILDAYERERLPITDQVSRFAMSHAERMIRSRAGVPDDIEADGPQGDAVRESFGRAMVDLNVAQYCCAGLNFGYYYDDSPIIAYDGEAQPQYTMGEFTPSSVPGCRLPHRWLGDGRSLYDALGSGYTLLKLDTDVDTVAFQDHAQRRKVPLTQVDLTAEESLPTGRYRLLLVRPDQHIAWRGEHPPPNPGDLIDHVRGADPLPNDAPRSTPHIAR